MKLRPECTIPKGLLVFHWRLLCGAAIIFTACFTCAQEGEAVPEAAKTLSLNDCFELAVNNRPEIQAAQLQIEADQYAFEASTKISLPTFRLEGGPALVGTTASSRQQQRFAPARVKFEVNQPVYTWGINANTVSNVEKAIQSSRLAEDAQKLDLKLEVAGHFYDVFYYDKVLSVLKETIQEAEVQREKVSGFHETGRLPQTDLLRLLYFLHQLQGEQREAAANLERARRQLRQSIGLPEDDASRFAPPEEEPPEELPPLSEALKVAERSNPSLNQVRNNRELLEGQIRIQSAKTKPQIGAYFSYSPQELSYLSGSQQFVSRDIYEMGVRVSWSIFDWGQNSYEVRRLEALQRRNDRTLRAAMLDLNGRIRDIYYRFRTLREMAPVLVAQRGLALERLGLAKEAYFAGDTSYRDVLDALKDYEDALVSRAQNSNDLARAWTEFKLYSVEPH